MISRQEAAEMLRTDPQTVSNWIDKGVLRGKMVGRIMMVDSDTINRLFGSLEDVVNSEKVIAEMKAKYVETVNKLRTACEEWQKDVATVNGLERPSRLVRMFYSMVDGVGNEIMTERERVILKKFLDGSEFEAIGDDFGLTRERVRQIVEKAMRKLGSLEPYGDVVSRCNALDDENRLIKATLKRQESELAELRYKPNHQTGEEKALGALSETDRLVVEQLNTRLVDMNLTVRALNCLKSVDMETFGDLVKCDKTTLLKCRNFGKKSLGELDDLLDAVSTSIGVKFYFGMDVQPYYDRFTMSLIENGGENGIAETE